MSIAPAKLVEAGNYLDGKARYSFLGIVGDGNHTYGYHLGKDRLTAGDYSIQWDRDKHGLSYAASAIDIGASSSADLVKLCDWMVGQAKRGLRPDTREIIGPQLNGRAYRWAVDDGWVGHIRSDGDDHETHIHESFFRDSEFKDKVQYYSPFFEGDEDDMTPAELFAAQLPTGGSFGGAIKTLLDRTNYLANVLGLAGRLDAILAAALDDDDVTVVLAPEALTALTEIKDELTKVASDTADELRDRLAE